MRIVKRFLIAVSFLTAFPIQHKEKLKEEDLGKSMICFPLVGLLIGLCLVIANGILSSFLPQRIVNLLIIVLLLLITSALHIDGLADTADAFFSSKDKKKMLDIMRDSSIGVMGVTAVVVILLLKYELLNNITMEMKNAALFIMPVMGRISLVVSAFFFPYARKEGGKGKSFVDYVGSRECLISLVIVFIISIFLLHIYGVVVVGICFFFGLLISFYIRLRIGGVTGDTLGAVGELVEVIALMTLLVYV